MQTITVQVLSDQAMPMLRQMERDKVVKLVHPPKSTRRLAERFEVLYQTWRKETLLSSSGSEIIGHPAYRKMITLGKPAVPLMLQKLKDDPYFIFDALTTITGEDPMPPSHSGRLSKMAEDWLEWGRKNGYVIL